MNGLGKKEGRGASNQRRSTADKFTGASREKIMKFDNFTILV
jgi:hypothetical protein